MNAIFVYNYEFGYELLSFSGILRKNRSKFNKLYVCSFSHSEIFYKDFVDKFICIPEFLLKNKIAHNVEDFCMNDFKSYLSNIVDMKKFSFFYNHNHEMFKNKEILDLYEKNGLYINFFENYNIKKENRICFFVRNHIIHDFRNYEIKKVKNFLNLLKKTGMQIDVIVFSNNQYNSADDYFLEGVNLIKNPTIEKQIIIHLRSKCIIYNHSGAAFLSLFNKNRTPLFVFGIKHDCERLYGDINNIFYKRLKKFQYLSSKSNNINDIDESILYEKFINFFNTI